MLIIPFLHICDNPLNVYKYTFFRLRSNDAALDSRIAPETQSQLRVGGGGELCKNHAAPGMSCAHPIFYEYRF